MPQGESLPEQATPTGEKVRALFIDTNIFIHFPPLKDFDWCKLTAAPVVKIVVCSPVISELDSHKNDQKLKERAVRSQREIETALNAGGELRRNVSLVVDYVEIPDSEFAHALSPHSTDDRIIMHAIRYACEHPAEEVEVISDDLGMRLKCQPRGLKVLRMPDGTKLPLPADEQTKKLKQLMEENERLKNPVPRIVVTTKVRAVDADGIPSREQVSLSPERPCSAIDKASERAREELKWIRAESEPKYSSKPEAGEFVAALAFLTETDEEEEKRYKADLRKYEEVVTNHAAHLAEARLLVLRAAHLFLYVGNEGNTPAESVDIAFTFPGGFMLYDEPSVLMVPVMPKRPEPPRTKLAMMMKESTLTFPDISDLIYGRKVICPSFPSSPNHLSAPNAWLDNIKESAAGFTVSYSIKTLRHGSPYDERLPPLLLVFDNWDRVHPFNVSYTIHASNISAPVVGEIPVLITRPGQAPAG